jgi:cytochrome c-type biogenesis protein CcmH
MTLWLVFALMTAAAVFAVLWPLARRTLACDPTSCAASRATSKALSSKVE